MSESIQVVIEGRDPYVRGFLRGLAAGGGTGRWPLFHADLGIESRSAGEVLKEWVGLHRDATWAVIDARDLDAVRRAVDDPREPELALRSAQPIEAARFRFEVQTYSAELGAQIRASFEGLPAGVTLVGWDPLERRDPSAQGVELYAPTHDYELRGSGQIDGPFRAVLVLHEQARRTDLVRESRLELELGAELGDPPAGV